MKTQEQIQTFREESKQILASHKRQATEEQQRCFHTFPRVSGQWDINGNLHLICTACLENRTYLAPDAFEKQAYAAYLSGHIGGQGVTNIVFLNKKAQQEITWRFIFNLVKGKVNQWKTKFI